MKKNKKRIQFYKRKTESVYKKLRKQISIRIDIDTIEYFKRKAEEAGIAYQNLINLYLADCAVHSRNINIVWK
jgi:predicted DNA binding CopG/RHH family protein